MVSPHFLGFQIPRIVRIHPTYRCNTLTSFLPPLHKANLKDRLECGIEWVEISASLKAVSILSGSSSLQSHALAYLYVLLEGRAAGVALDGLEPLNHFRDTSKVFTPAVHPQVFVFQRTKPQFPGSSRSLPLPPMGVV